MNKLIEATMKRTVLIITSLVLILVWGGVSAYQMQRDYLPPINNPTLMVSIHAQDYQAAQVKTFISGPIEQSFRTVNGLETLETNSFDGGLLISLYFPLDYSMDRAESDVSSALDHVALPADVDKPVVTRVSSSSFPIMRLSLTSPPGKVDENTLRTTVQTKIINELKAMPGVSDIRVIGAGSNGYVLSLRMADLRKAGLTIDDVKQSLSQVHWTWAQGNITSTQVTIPLQASVWMQSEQDLKQLPIHGSDGHVVPLSAIGDVAKSVVDLKTISRTDGSASVVFDVLKTPSSNITDVSQRIHDRIQNIPGLSPGDIHLAVLFDQGEQVKSSLNSLFKEGLLGCLLSMVCIFLFFRNARSSMLIALSLPICLLATTGLLKMMGISLNILTVSGLIVAMGRVVDDSIVILDNMYRKAHESREKVNSVLLAEAVREMIPAIVSSTATTVAVYIPIALVGGMISSAFSGFAWSVVIALLTSLLVAVFVVPALYHLWQGGRKNDSAVSIEPVSRRVLSWAFLRKGRIIAAFVTILLIAGSGAFFLPVNFLPANKIGQINVQLEFSEGTSLPEMDATVRRMEQTLKSDPNITTFSSVLGSTFTPQFDDVFDAGGGWIQGANIANIMVSIKEKANVDVMTAELQKRLSTLAGSAICTVTNQNISGNDSQLKIDLSGADAVTLDNAATTIRSKLQLVPGLSVVGAADNKEVLPRVQISLNQASIEQTGVDTEAIFRRIRNYLSEGMRIDVRAGNKETIPLVIHTDLISNIANSSAGSPNADTLTLLGKETFKGKDGQDVRLDQLASVSTGNGQSVIREREGRPFSVVTANITSRDIGKVTGQVQDTIDHLALPSGVKYSINGISAQVNQMILQMGIALSVSIVLVLLIVSMVFRGWRAPLTVLVCIPFAFIGSIIGMLVWGGEWNLAALVGLLMLSGIVATNGIVLVDKIERNLASGMNPKEAILQGTVSRVRPVLMTAAVTILTLFPLCISGSGDTIVSQTLGIVVVCGMISSTMISLLIIPLLYEWMHYRRPLVVRKRNLSTKPVVSQ
ncbi:efflux RND transporter permease subunit [Paenibacillus filicis]|uniref:Efflux RND transporter permease subunit n=1 Tax=Paenibacillus gyeongsangnamensis TaxID=3388067 RepID=A0ABT4QII9_9BACL|nr:efflux RND transporter permease subunit [Paenibacillus filicis]MCZ8516658.1 efflux RND transporter permease subunit [Paenibacillus filicis]